MKIKLHQPVTTADGKNLYRRLDRNTGRLDQDYVTEEEFNRNPNEFEVVESSGPSINNLVKGAERIIEQRRQRTNLHESAPLGPGWVRVPIKPDPRRVAELREHEERVTEAKKRGVPLTAVVTEADKKEFSRRTREAFKLLGFSEEKARIAAHEDQDVLAEAWNALLGVEKGKIARGAK